MDGDEITQRVKAVTRGHLGRGVSPHLFRDCVATDIAIHDPGHIGIVKTILGHATLATSEKYYNQAGNFHAANRLQTVITHLRA
jgi:integrase